MKPAALSTSYFSAPLWSVGFRPFFIAACLSGALMPLVWIAAYSGAISYPTLAFDPFISPLHWHMHEMFFGFGWALLGGFLLTATKNWVGIRGRNGLILILLIILWLLDRLSMAYGGDWPLALVYGLSFPFIVLVTVLLEIDLIRNHAKDSYRDNAYFILALPLFVAAKFALLSTEIDPALGVSMTLGLFRLCFLLMLERTLEAFMKGALGITLKRHLPMDHAIKALGFVLIFAYSITPYLQSSIFLLAAFLMLIRWFYWHPFKALRRIDIGVMYLGYLAIVANLALQGMQPFFGHWANSVATHVFTLGTIGLIAPAMIVRISNGHTGRKVTFTQIDKLAIYLMLLALVFRIAIPFFAPDAYTSCLFISALCWLGTFSIIGYRYIPMLLSPRIDGKVH